MLYQTGMLPQVQREELGSSVLEKRYTEMYKTWISIMLYSIYTNTMFNSLRVPQMDLCSKTTGALFLSKKVICLFKSKIL